MTTKCDRNLIKLLFITILCYSHFIHLLTETPFGNTNAYIRIMSMSKLSTKIGISDLQKLAIYLHSGTVHILTKKGVFHRNDWEEKYIVICKGNAITWNLLVYPRRFSSAADKTYSLLEIESVLEYNDVIMNEDVIGFSIKFVDPKEDQLIFRCDTEVKRQKWIEHFSTAILEAHSDSGYNSAGSVSKGKSRQSTGYDTIGEVEKSRSEHVSSTGEKEMGMTEDDIGQRKSDETHVKEVYRGSVQESMTQMENLKMPLPKEDDNCAHHHSTNTTGKDRAQDAMKPRRPSLITPNAGTDRLVSELHSKFSKHGNALLEKVSAHTSENNTVPRLPATPLCPPEHIDAASSSSYLSVQGYSCSGSGAFVSMKEDAASSSSANEVTPHSVTVQSKTPTRMQDGNHKDPTSLDTASLFGLDETETWSSSQKDSRFRTAQTLTKRNSSGTGASHRDVPMSSTYKPSPSRTEDAQTPLHRTEAMSRVPEVIHENTENIITEYNGGSETSEFDSNKDRSMHSSISASSFSSSDSKGSLTVPEEDTDYEKIFPRDAYFCDDQKNVKQIMKNVSIGTFLVCDGKKQNLEMYVMTPIGIEHFRVYKQVNKCSLYGDFSNQVLRNLDSLLFHYHNNNLPFKSYKVKLKRGYKGDRD